MVGRIRVAFVLTGLPVGGAEMMLWKLLSRIDRTRFAPVVFTLTSQSDGLLPRFEASGVECHCMGMKRATGALSGLFRLASALRRFAPHIVQGWMYQGNVAASAAALCVRNRPVVLWSVRAGLTALAEEKWHVALPIWLGGKLSSWPDKIINNSVVSAIEHEERLGYSRERRHIVPNGFDTDLFRPSTQARTALRAALHLAPDTVLVGLVSRYHPVKNHAGFLRAAAAVSRAHPHVHYVMAGDGVDAANPQLARLVAQHALGGRAHLLGRSHEVHKLTAGLDVAVSCSTAEGFSNVIGEAMSCGVPCVVTDVGDSGHLVADTGKIVPRDDADALAAALNELIAAGPSERADLGRRARARIIGNFSLAAIVRQYENLYIQLIDGQRTRA